MKRWKAIQNKNWRGQITEMVLIKSWESENGQWVCKWPRKMEEVMTAPHLTLEALHGVGYPVPCLTQSSSLLLTSGHPFGGILSGKADISRF